MKSAFWSPWKEAEREADRGRERESGRQRESENARERERERERQSKKREGERDREKESKKAPETCCNVYAHTDSGAEGEPQTDRQIRLKDGQTRGHPEPRAQQVLLLAFAAIGIMLPPCQLFRNRDHALAMLVSAE